MMVKNQIDLSLVAIPIQVCVTVVAVFLAKQLPQYFRSIKTFAENKKLIKELRIIELFCMLLVIAHIFVLHALSRVSSSIRPSI